mmetsp:Transcript_16206/g.48769  ORF Transcript_16206/g.48769 Transcript_16206/m.48769 type:complete len:202 (+) Transcript_16206:133-738(+)
MGACHSMDEFEEVIDLADGGGWTVRRETWPRPKEYEIRYSDGCSPNMYVVCCVFFVFCCVVGAVEVDQHTARHVTWPFFLLMAIISIMLVAQADGQVTRVERTETHLVIASGWDSGWPIPIDRIDAVGVRRKVPFAWLQFGVVADCVGVRTTLRDHKCGASVRFHRFRLQDVDAFVKENFVRDPDYELLSREDEAAANKKL